MSPTIWLPWQRPLPSKGALNILRVVTSRHVPDMSAMMRLPWQRPLPSNGALNILQLWASGGRTREPILMKFGTQQQVRTALTVMRSNIKIFKIQNGRRPPCWKWIRNAIFLITRLPMDRLGCNLGGHIPSCPRHVRRDAVAMATAAAYQRRIERSAVMGVWRPNAWTNFDEIRYNGSHVIKYWNF